MTCLVITKAEGRAFYAKYTTRKADPRTRAMVETVDNAAVSDALFEHVVVSWTGVIAGDGQAAECNTGNKQAIDDRVKAQVVLVVLGSEVTGRGPETF